MHMISENWHPRVILPILGWGVVFLLGLAVIIPVFLFALRWFVHFLIY